MDSVVWQHGRKQVVTKGTMEIKQLAKFEG